MSVYQSSKKSLYWELGQHKHAYLVREESVCTCMCVKRAAESGGAIGKVRLLSRAHLLSLHQGLIKLLYWTTTVAQHSVQGIHTCALDRVYSHHTANSSMKIKHQEIILKNKVTLKNGTTKSLHFTKRARREKIRDAEYLQWKSRWQKQGMEIP